MIRAGSQKRHGLGAAVAQTVDAMATALNAVATTIRFVRYCSMTLRCTPPAAYAPS